MEKQRVCKICSKRFSNGKAMGGHMRSHLAKLPVPPKPPQLLNVTESTLPMNYRPSPSSSSSFNINHPNKFFRIQPHRSADYSLAAHLDQSVQDGESETDSHPKNPTRKRSKRHRDPVDDDEQAEPVSSVSETFSTEDVAWCLLMMSRDRWDKEEAEKEGDFVYDSQDEDEDDEDSLICRQQKNHRSRAKFKCKTCNKAFTSYQALGGHKASHRKIHNNGAEEFESGCKLAVHQRVFECPFCPKVFESGQALGGHKKIHLSHLGNVKKTPLVKFGRNSIDLNRPAPDYDEEEEEDEDEEVVSQAEFSAVSNPTKLFQTHHRFK